MVIVGWWLLDMFMLKPLLKKKKRVRKVEDLCNLWRMEILFKMDKKSQDMMNNKLEGWRAGLKVWEHNWKRVRKISAITKISG